MQASRQNLGGLPVNGEQYFWPQESGSEGYRTPRTTALSDGRFSILS